MDNIKKVQNHEYHVPEESREKMDVEKPKRYNEDRNRLHSNKHVTVIKQDNIESDHRKVMSNINLDIELERKEIDDQESTKRRWHTNRIKEDRIPTRIEKPIRNITISN